MTRRAILAFAGTAVAASALLAAGATHANAGTVGGGAGGSGANSGGTGGHVTCAYGGNGGDAGQPGTSGHVDTTCAPPPPPVVTAVGVDCGHITYTITATKGTKFEVVDMPADTVPFSPGIVFTAAAAGTFTHTVTLVAATRSLPGPDTLTLFAGPKYATLLHSDQVPWDCGGDTSSAPPSATGTPSGSAPVTTSAAPSSTASTPSAGTSTPAATTSGPPVPDSSSPPASSSTPGITGVSLASATGELAETGPKYLANLLMIGLGLLVGGAWITFGRSLILALRRRGDS